MQILDPNFIYNEIQRDDLKFYDVRSDNFAIFGFIESSLKGEFLRMPKDIARKVNVGVDGANPCNAGGRVAFITNSKEICVSALVKPFMDAKFSATSAVGLDIYMSKYGRFQRVYVVRPKNDPNLPFAGVYTFPEGEKKIIINLPNYGAVKELKIGVTPDSFVKPFDPYRRDIKPIVYYGSSITQGGCASVGGNAYQNIISRRNNIDFINLGFSGWAKGEPIMAEYVASLDMGAFVLDYDHNAYVLEDYKNTHYPFYKTVREKHKDIPIIIVTRPDVRRIDSPADDRIEVALSTYNRAKEEGDKNVYFINGYDLFGDKDPDICTVDGCHPNDLGFYRMADVIGKVIDKALKL